VVRADVAELERRLKAGEWLTPGQVAKLLDLSRSKIHNMLTAGDIGTARKRGSEHRVCDPADVTRELAGLREDRAAAGRHGDPPTAAPPGNTETS
jgi:hypothetical protein